MIYSVPVFLAVAAVLVTPAAEASAAQPVLIQTEIRADPSLDGRWEGAMSVPGGITIHFRLDIVGAGGTFAAPDMDVSGVPIEVVRDDRYVSVRLARAGANFDAEISEDGTRISGTWAQGGRAFPAVFTRGGDAVAERAQTPRGPFPYSSTDVAVPGGIEEVRLAATLALPAAQGPVPAVLLLGGNGPQTRDGTYSGHRPMAVVADRLARHGIGSLRYDKRGAGASSGAYNQATGEDFAADATSALAWLRAQPGVDAARTCVLGWSEGALLALMVASAHSPACVVLLSPPGLSGPALVAEQARLRVLSAGGNPTAAQDEADLAHSIASARIGGAQGPALAALAISRGRSPDESDRLAREAVSPELNVFLETDPAVVAERVSVPVLIVAGALDQQTPPDVNLPPLRRALARNAGLVVAQFDDLNHALQPALTGEPAEYATLPITIDERALAVVLDFVQEAVDPAARP